MLKQKQDDCTVQIYLVPSRVRSSLSASCFQMHKDLRSTHPQQTVWYSQQEHGGRCACWLSRSLLALSALLSNVCSVTHNFILAFSQLHFCCNQISSYIERICLGKGEQSKSLNFFCGHHKGCDI